MATPYPLPPQAPVGAGSSLGAYPPSIGRNIEDDFIQSGLQRDVMRMMASPGTVTADIGGMRMAAPRDAADYSQRKDSWMQLLGGMSQDGNLMKALLMAAAAIAAPIDPRKGETVLQRLLQGGVVGLEAFDQERRIATEEARKVRQEGRLDQQIEMQRERLDLERTRTEGEAQSRSLLNRYREALIGKTEEELAAAPERREMQRLELELRKKQLDLAEVGAELRRGELEIAQKKLRNDPELLLVGVVEQELREEGLDEPTAMDRLRKMSEVKSRLSTMSFDEFRNFWIKEGAIRIGQGLAEAGEFLGEEAQESWNNLLTEEFIRTLYKQLYGRIPPSGGDTSRRQSGSIERPVRPRRIQLDASGNPIGG